MSIKVGDIFGSDPFAVRASASNLFAFALISAAVILVVWKNFSFPASQTSIVVLLSLSGFFVLYLPLQYFIGYTYTLLLTSATLLTIIGLIASHIHKRIASRRKVFTGECYLNIGYLILKGYGLWLKTKKGLDTRQRRNV